jgi:hypothetical protein
MVSIRRALARVAVLCLLCECAPLAMAPVVFWTGATADALECTCSQGDHAMCPLHHRSRPAAGRCAMRGLSDTGTVVVASLLGAIGIVPDVRTVAAAPDTMPIVGEPVSPARRSSSPDSPPPRL